MAYTEINALYDRVFNRFENEDLISKAEVLQMIAAAPAEDVAEAKHGYWKRTEEPLGWQEVTLAECSVCGEGWLTDDNFSIEEFVDYWHYCPNCGAKMDLKEGVK